MHSKIKLHFAMMQNIFLNLTMPKILIEKPLSLRFKRNVINLEKIAKKKQKITFCMIIHSFFLDQLII